MRHRRRQIAKFAVLGVIYTRPGSSLLDITRVSGLRAGPAVVALDELEGVGLVDAAWDDERSHRTYTATGRP